MDEVGVLWLCLWCVWAVHFMSCPVFGIHCWMIVDEFHILWSISSLKKLCFIIYFRFTDSVFCVSCWVQAFRAMFHVWDSLLDGCRWISYSVIYIGSEENHVLPHIFIFVSHVEHEAFHTLFHVWDSLLSACEAVSCFAVYIKSGLLRIWDSCFMICVGSGEVVFCSIFSLFYASCRV